MVDDVTLVVTQNVGNPSLLMMLQCCPIILVTFFFFFLALLPSITLHDGKKNQPDRQNKS